MKLLKISLVLFLTGLHVVLFAQNKKIEKTLLQRGEAIISIDADMLDKVPNLQTLSLDHNPIRDGRAFFYVNKKHYKMFKELGIEMQFEEAPSLNNKVSMARTVEEVKNWDTYPSYDAYVDMMKQFATDYPELCALDTIGYSVDGRLVLSVKISDNVDNEETEEPNFFYTSSMHGDELVGYVLMLRLIDYLLVNYNSNDRVRNMVNNIEIYINPLANPDGAYHSGNNTVSGATRYNANYVDLNRNFPGPVSGDHPDGEATQIETADMMAFMQEHKFKMSMNHHGGAEVLNYPWDYKYELHPDNDWFINVCREYADTVHVYDSYYMNGFDNGITNGADWYSIEGGRQDYATYFLNGREVTSELSDTKLPSADQLPGFWDKNYRSLLNYIEQVIYGVSGTVTNESGTLLDAKVFINGHDDESSHVFTNQGYYHRLIAGGTYQITYEAEGYNSKTINVTVSNNGVTIQNVVLDVYDGDASVQLSTDVETPTNASLVAVNIEFDKNISGFEVSDISVTNAEVGNLQMVSATSVFSVDVTPTNDGVVTVFIDEGVVEPTNLASNTISFIYDKTAPKNTLFDVVNVTNTSFEINAKFDEAGILYYASSLEGSEPTANQIVEGGVANSGNTSITANGLVNIKIDNLEPNKTYDAFLVSIDALGNVSEVYSKKIFTDIFDELGNGLKLYPNPVKDKLFISSEMNVDKLLITDINGKTTEFEIEKTNELSVDLTNFTSGVYFVFITSNNKTLVRKIIVE